VLIQAKERRPRVQKAPREKREKREKQEIVGEEKQKQQSESTPRRLDKPKRDTKSDTRQKAPLTESYKNTETVIRASRPLQLRRLAANTT
jgi:hypothetical protein